jgi:hypothetical protein
MWPQGAPGFKEANFGENASFAFEDQFCKYLCIKMTEQYRISRNFLCFMLLKE